MTTREWTDGELEDLAQILTLDDIGDHVWWLDTRTHQTVPVDRPLGADYRDEPVPPGPDHVHVPLGRRGPHLGDFLHAVPDPHLAQVLRDAAHGGRGAYRRVKGELHRRDRMDLWNAWEQAELRELAREWLREVGILPPEPYDEE